MEGYNYEDTSKGRGVKPVIAYDMDMGLSLRAIKEMFN
jgi:hypothetical protein